MALDLAHGLRLRMHHSHLEDGGGFRTLEISSAFSHLPHKDMARESPADSPVLGRRGGNGGGGGGGSGVEMNHINHHPLAHHPPAGGNGGGSGGNMQLDPVRHEAFQQQIMQLEPHDLTTHREEGVKATPTHGANCAQIDTSGYWLLATQLKKQQQLQQQILLQHFQQQQQQLAEQHEQQLRQHLKLWEQQKQEEERERREKERLEALKKKEKHEQSAVASTEVKQKLQGFLLNKKQQREQQQQQQQAAVGSLPPGALPPTNTTQPQPFRNWSVVQPPVQGNEPSPSEPSLSTPHPYRLPILGKYSEDFPLRKTDTSSSNPDSGPNSPPSVIAAQASPTAGRNTPIQEEGEVSPYGPLASSSQQGSMSDLSLYSSPSMPNISLGRPPAHSNSSSDGGKLAPVSEAEVRAAFTARLGMPLTGQMLAGTLPFYPTLPVIDGEYSNPSSPNYIHKQMQSLEQGHSRPSSGVCVYPGAPITDTQVAHARLNKRPLGRTQSAPLPLGHPMLQGSSSSSSAGFGLAPTHEDYMTQEKHFEQQQQAHNFLKQHIRQTVLTRVGSRGQSAGALLDEAHENEETAEVIDLTDRKGEESEISKQQRDREQFLQQQRDLMMRHTLQVSEGSAFSPRTSHIARPLSRALSSPLVALAASEAVKGTTGGSPAHRPTTGLAFDSLMLKHACVCGDNSSHPEHGGRLQSVWARLVETGLVGRCERVRSRKATLEELQACHSEAYALLFGTNPLNRQKLAHLPLKSFVRLPCGGIGVDSDTTWNDLHTAPAARMAVGCVVELALKAATGEIRNGFAVVRPPGHHAETSQAMGFCFFNSVAIAARQLQQRLDVQKIMIVDWDVHHGNGTQQMFYDDPRVLYLSIHRHDDGNFFPGTGGPMECGAGEGVGANVNVAWSGGLAPPMGDAEYLAAFRSIVMPIGREFAPDVVLVSAGFDAADGHAAPLGGYKVSPACFGHMTQQLLQLADGKVVLSLEGGYDLPSICDSAQECVRALLGDEPSPLREEELCRPPCQNAIDTLQKTIAIQLLHWPCIKRTAHLVMMSALGAAQKEKEETETVTAMAGLSMRQHSNSLHTPEHSRETSEEPMEQDDAK